MTLYTPSGQKVLWTPNPGPQTRFIASSVYELLYGGAAGGGKSEALVMAPTRWIGDKFFRGILFRRTFPELDKSLVERTRFYYPALGGKYHGGEHVWTFPSGAKIWLSSLQYADSVIDHQSSEYQFVGFDELTHFEESQYRYLLSRLRSSRGVPIRVRAGTNPDICWVKDRWAPWVNRSPEYLESGGPIAESGEVLWFKPNASGGEEYVPAGTPGATSRSFIRSALKDTPQLGKDYELQLLQQDSVQRARLMDGDWEAIPAAGKYFKKDWVDFCSRDSIPKGSRLVRHWDRAGTEKGERKSKDPDWTAGVLLARKGAHYWVVDVQRFRATPGKVDEAIIRTAKSDGRGTTISLAQDPGQAGKDQSHRMVRLLSGYTVRSRTETGDKIRRFSPFSSQAEHHNVSMVKGGWNDNYVHELESFPDGRHDDQVDATSGAFLALSVSSVGGMGTHAIPFY